MTRGYATGVILRSPLVGRCARKVSVILVGLKREHTREDL